MQLGIISITQITKKLRGWYWSCITPPMKNPRVGHTKSTASFHRFFPVSPVTFPTKMTQNSPMWCGQTTPLADVQLIAPTRPSVSSGRMCVAMPKSANFNVAVDASCAMLPRVQNRDVNSVNKHVGEHPLNFYV